MHDSSDVESLEELYGDYGFDADDAAVQDHFESAENNSEGLDFSILRRKQENCTVLSEADIRRRLEDDISGISSVLSISRADAGILLRLYNWTECKVHEEWFADEERVRKYAGLLKNPVVVNSDARELTCGICFETILKDDIYSASCGHPYCRLCWAGYISNAINDGSGCLMLRCPDPPCKAAVGQDMVDALCSEDDKKKYLNYFRRSYIEDNREKQLDFKLKVIGGELSAIPGISDTLAVLCVLLAAPAAFRKKNLYNQLCEIEVNVKHNLICTHLLLEQGHSAKST